MSDFKSPNISLENQLTVLMDQYEKDLLKICFVYLQNISLAEDAVQETFLKAYKGLPSFRRDCSEKTWLIRIAINTCKDIRRGSWFRNMDRHHALESLSAQEAPPKTESVFITLAIMGLPPKEKEVILLHFYQNMTVTEISKVLGISCSAVSKRIKQARQKLQSVLKGDVDDV